MLFLVYYGEYYKMNLNQAELNFIDDVLNTALDVLDPNDLTPVNTPEQKTDKLFLIVSNLEIMNLAYLNDQSKSLLEALDYYTEEYDAIEKIDFYDWCKDHLDLVEYCLDHDDYENSDHKKIIEKIFGKSVDK